MKYIIKKLINHPAAANTDANKQLRVEVVSPLITYIQIGYIWVSIDEIHFQVGPYHLYGHASCGKKGIGNCMPAYSDYSSITAIDRMGNKPFSLFVKGNGNVLVFVDNFRMILSHYKGKRCFFFIDNAWVHNRDDLKYLCDETYQIILFNAPYQCTGKVGKV